MLEGLAVTETDETVTGTVTVIGAEPEILV
jgi:hypothetical protein